MEHPHFCQSFAMPLMQETNHGLGKDGLRSPDYCRYCYQNGAFTTDETMKQMMETCIPFALEAGVYADAETAQATMRVYYPGLKRWAKA